MYLIEICAAAEKITKLDYLIKIIYLNLLNNFFTFFY